MEVHDFLSLLEEVRETGSDRWMARCPAHDDSTPSLSIQATDDKILIHCFAGCSPQEIVESLGLELKDLFIRPNGDPAEERGIPVATYVYTDEHGSPLYRVVRYYVPDSKRPKRFAQEIWNPRTETWEGGKGCMDRVRKVLYRLPELIAAPKDEPVWLCEGEKDADHLAFHGLVATTNVGGAKNWRPEYNIYLAGRKVYILEDNDEAGKERSQYLAEELSLLAEEVKIIRLPDLSQKEDVTDWLLRGHTVDELREIADATPQYRSITSAVIKGAFGVYTIEWPELGIHAKVEGVDWSSHLDATVIVSFYAYGKLIMPRTKVNLLSSRTRVMLANDLEERARTGIWQRIVEEITTKLLDKDRLRDPVEIITDETPYKETGYLVEPLLPWNLPAIIYGDGESGKTMVAVLISILVASGQSLPHLGLKVHHQGGVLYLDYEGTRDIFARRLKYLCRGLGVKAAIQYATCKLPLAEDFERISRIVMDFDPVLIVVDSAALAALPGLKDPLDTARSIIAPLTQLGRTALVIAHTPKHSEDTIYGSVFFRNLARSVWHAQAFRSVEDPNLEVALTHDKANEDRRHRPIGLRFNFLSDRIVVQWTNPADIPGIDLGTSISSKEIVVDYLRAEGASTVRDISEATGLSVHTVRSILKDLREGNRVIRLKGGRYGIAARPDEVPTLDVADADGEDVVPF